MRKSKHRYSNKKLSRGEPPNFTGQHLMHNKKTLQEIVNKAKISSNDLVVEFGAGKGALTELIVSKAQRLLALEIEKRFIEHLERKFYETSNIKIISQDILKFNLPKQEFVVVSNIPYAITTPIMKMLLNNPNNGLQRAIIVMEKGAAKRFTAKRVKDSYVLQWRMFYDLKIERTVPRTDFSPPPKVDSAMLSIIKRKDPYIPVRYSSQFRKIVEPVLKRPDAPIGNALLYLFTPKQLKHLRRTLGVNNEYKVGYLSEEQWRIIFKTIIDFSPHLLKSFK